jgi:cytochrome P450
MATSTTPAHVPADRVKHFSLVDRTTVDQDPFRTMILPVLDGPAVFYAPNFFPAPNGAWVPRRAKDLRVIYADTEHFSKSGNTRIASMIGESWDIIPTELDPPRHTEFRIALNPIFSPRAMAELEHKVQERAILWINRFRDQGGCEFIKDFAIPFPVTIFLDLVGLPQDEMELFLKWEFDIIHSTNMEDRKSSTREVKAYLLEAIEERRKNPRDDLISNALKLKVGGRPWTAEEVFGHCFNLYLGGLDTVTSNVGIHVYHLATHPADQEVLRANPERIGAAGDELMRYYAAVTTARICTKPYKIDGITMQPGDYVAMSTPLAGHDPEEYAQPEEIRFDRNAQSVTLGFGPHMCLGRHLARREIRVALTELLNAVPAFSIKPGSHIRFRTGNVIHVESLPLEWALVDGKKSPTALFRTSPSLPAAKGAAFAAYPSGTSASPTGCR